MGTAVDWPPGLKKNFKLMALEVSKQFERTQRMLERPTERLMWTIRRRDDYIDHLKSLIENTCFTYLRRHGNIEKVTADLIRSTTTITSNLERMADYTVNIVRQTAHFSVPTFLNRFDYRPFFTGIQRALQAVPGATLERDADKAISICEAEAEVDALYAAMFDAVLEQMTVEPEEAPNLVTSLFIFHYLERAGDSLLNIGEAILFSAVGERLKFNQFRSIRSTLAAARGEGAALPDGRLVDLDVEGIWGTRSGCAIGKVSGGEDGVEHEVIYKEGDRLKLRQEREQIELWEKVAPGVAPRVFEYQEHEEHATLLIEYLEGSTLQEIILNPGSGLLEEAVRRTQSLLRETWTSTMRREPTAPGFLEQLAARLEDVYKVHPRFRGRNKKIGALEIPGFDELVERNRHLDEDLKSPVSVFGHGDFNLDNVIYNATTGRVHYIDLHRSRQMDYVHDISVLLVSNFRIPVFDAPIRSRLHRVIDGFYSFAQDFADGQGDATFDARLALGLVRSLATSTRFEVDQAFANDMLWRASYLLERIEAHHARKRSWGDFFLPRNVLFG
jgi:phosphate uptake regulator